MKQMKYRWLPAAALLLCAVPATASAAHLSAYGPMTSPDNAVYILRARFAYRLGLQAYLYGRPLVEAYQARKASGIGPQLWGAAPPSSGCGLTAWAAGHAMAPTGGGKATGPVTKGPPASGKGETGDLGKDQPVPEGEDLGAQGEGPQASSGQGGKGVPFPGPSLPGQAQEGLEDDACLSTAPPPDLGDGSVSAPMDQQQMQFFVSLNEALTITPPPPEHQVLLNAFAQIGVGPGRAFPAEQLDEATRQGLASAVEDGERFIGQISSIGRQ